MYCVEAPAQLGYDRTTARASHELYGGPHFGSHAAFAKRAFRVKRIGFIHRELDQSALLVCSPIGVDGIDIGEYQEKLGSELTRENRRR